MATERILRASELTIDLSRLRQNHQIVVRRAAGASVAAMVKANGYGLGAAEVSGALAASGCTEFFVAHVSEGMAVRAAVPNAKIQVLNGAMPDTETDLIEHNLVPVLNSLEQIDLWRAAALDHGEPLEATLHFDTGMSRLGMAADETASLLADPGRVDGLSVTHVMSHLASADVANSSQPADQFDLFAAVRPHFPKASASFANSAGIFLDSAYHFDVVRPGIALYGGTPLTDGTNPMLQVATLEAPIVQVRNVEAGETIGYGATHTMDRDGRVATVALGYADGFLRSSSNRGAGFVDGHAVPIVGRVSMDLITLDVSDVPEASLWLGAPVELIGDQAPIDDVAGRAGSIANELLTDLGTRYQRVYIN